MKKSRGKKQERVNETTAMQGAKTYGMPVALTSSAVEAPIFLTSSGSLVYKKLKSVLNHIKELTKAKLLVYSQASTD